MKNIKSIAIVVLVGAAIWFFKSWQSRGEELKRQKSNYENRIKEDSSAYVTYALDFKNEFQEYLGSTNNQLKGLEKKLDKANIEIRKIKSIASTRIIIKDTTVSTVVLDSISSILSKLEKNDSGVVIYPIKDKTDCFEFEARVIFEDNTVRHEVLKRQATDTINAVTNWTRKKHRWLLGIKTGFLGKKIYKVDLFNNCGFSKTIIINNSKK